MIKCHFRRRLPVCVPFDEILRRNLFVKDMRCATGKDYSISGWDCVYAAFGSGERSV